MHAVVEGLAEQRLAGSDGIGTVGDDEVETAFTGGPSEILEGVRDLDFEALVLERLGVDLAEVLAAELHDAPVDVDQHDLFDAFVLQRLVGDGEIAAAHDHHPARLGHAQEAVNASAFRRRRSRRAW